MKGKIIIPFFLILAMCVVAFSDPSAITAEKSDGYFDFDDSVSITVKNEDVKKIYQNLKIVNDKGEQVPYISNIINAQKIAISPVILGQGKVHIKNLEDYKVDIYDGVIYVQNQWNLEQISDNLYREYPFPYGLELRDMVGGEMKASAAPADGAMNFAKEESSPEHSTTNLQEKNVDEADVVKTDGQYIYYITDNTLFIVKNISGKMQISSCIKMEDDEEFIKDMYLNGDKLTLVTSDNNYDDKNSHPMTGVCIYDIKDRTKPVKIGSTYIDGYPMETRLIGSKIYVVSNHLFDYIENKGSEKKIGGTTSAMNIRYKLDPKSENLAKLIYFPNNPSDNITKITAYDINNFSRKDSIYMGLSDNLYMSEKNAYVTYQKWNFDGNKSLAKSSINRFALNDGDINYTGRCEVDGSLINQFSLAEKNGTLFVAYTNESQNNNAVASFDENLTNVGNLTGIAQGERIYSTRFDGNILYMVTFKEVDPLFAIDISNPANIQMKGYLKIPGYSTYLHPYKDNILIGFGQDTRNNEYNNVVNDGFKMALFDVKDLQNIKTLDEVLLGDMGSSSPLEYNHKAIMTDVKKDTIGFPVIVTKKEDRVDSKGNIYQDYNIIFNGALIYKIEDGKFINIGKISHAKNQEDLRESYNISIGRLIYIGDEIFTFTNSEIKSTSRDNWKEIDTLSLTKEKNKEYPTLN